MPIAGHDQFGARNHPSTTKKLPNNHDQLTKSSRFFVGGNWKILEDGLQFLKNFWLLIPGISQNSYVPTACRQRVRTGNRPQTAEDDDE